MIDILRANGELVRQVLRVSEVRYAAGKAAQQDIFKAQTQLSILETRVVRMEQEKRSAEAEINSLLARPPNSPLERPEDIEPGPLTASLEELFARAREHSPALRRQEKTVQQAELSVNLARTESRPDYTVSAGYFNMGRMPDMYQFRIDFTLPVWYWRKQHAGVTEQASALSQARHSLEAADRAVHFRIQDDFLLAETAQRLMRMYSDTVIPQAELTVESSMAAYENGTVDLLTVLSNLITRTEYGENYHEEVLSYHLALVRLEEQTGVVLP
jgi:outer membrane protein TolC